VKLVKEGYYDCTLFHRVIKDFMIQGGDPDSKGAPAGKMQKIQSAFNQLAKEHHDEIMQMRRERNRAGLQELLDKLAAEAEAQVTGEGLTEEQRTIYSTIGGTPHLDGQYTVFGEVEEGLDVVEMIQQTATARGDRPVDDIEMRMILVD
jgi:peptidyl-prolyl cis-trans isomerase B (cyclophilin B)